jgi:hypothetical protein
MDRQEKERLFIILTKLQVLKELSEDLKERLKDAGEDLEGKLKEEVGDLREKLEEISRDLYELGGELDALQEPAVRYDVNPIVRERLIRGWTQQVLAKNSKLHKATVSAILKRGSGSPKNLHALAKAVGLELADLIVGEAKRDKRGR